MNSKRPIEYSGIFRANVNRESQGRELSSVFVACGFEIFRFTQLLSAAPGLQGPDLSDDCWIPGPHSCLAQIVCDTAMFSTTDSKGNA